MLSATTGNSASFGVALRVPLPSTRAEEHGVAGLGPDLPCGKQLLDEIAV